MDVKTFFESELQPLPPGQPLARWTTVVAMHRRYIERGGQLSRPAFLVELEHEFPDMVFSDKGKGGLKVPYQLKGTDESIFLERFAAERLRRVEPLGRGVPRVRTAERKQSDWATVADLHAVYTEWAFTQGHRPLGLVRFAKGLASVIGATYPCYRFGASRLPVVINSELSV